MSNDSKRYASMAFATVCIAQMIFVGIGWNSISLYAAPITEEWGITRAAFMLTITLVATCNTIISMFFYGQLVEKLGLRKLIIIGGILTIAGFLCFSFAQNIVMLYATGILFGCGCALLNNNIVNAVCNAWYAKSPGTYMSIASTFGSVAGIVAATVVAAVIATTGWRPSLTIIAVIFAIITVVCAVLYKGTPAELGVSPIGADEVADGEEVATSIEETGPTYSDMLKSGKFWAVAVIMFVVGVAGYAILANLPLIVGDYGFENLSGTALSVALAASAICLIPFGRILDKAGARVMIAICFLLLVIAMALMLFGAVNSLPMVYVIAALVGAAYDMCLIAPGILVMDAFGRRDYAKKMGTVCGFCYAGVALAPTIMGLFYDLGGSYNVCYIIFIALAIVAAIAVFPLADRSKVQES